jgi:hypothetical protein
MARSDNTMTLLFLGIAGYFVYTNWPQISATFGIGTTGAGAGSLLCKFPDGSTIAMPSGNACPYDPNHGGQSTPCYPASFVGPLPTGGVHC